MPPSYRPENAFAPASGSNAASASCHSCCGHGTGLTPGFPIAATGARSTVAADASAIAMHDDLRMFVIPVLARSYSIDRSVRLQADHRGVRLQADRGGPANAGHYVGASGSSAGAEVRTPSRLRRNLSPHIGGHRS